MRGPKRELISRSYNSILHAVLRARFSDAQCGFKAARTDVVTGLSNRAALNHDAVEMLMALAAGGAYAALRNAEFAERRDAFLARAAAFRR